MPEIVTFETIAANILALPMVHRVNRLGGYGPAGEVIYEAHPLACPTTLVDRQGQATATFQSNGSVAFEVKLAQGLDVEVLEGSFDPVEKRETGVLSSNCWIEFAGAGGHHIASLLAARAHHNLPAEWIKIVKLGDPQRAMWYCARFAPAEQQRCETAVRLRLVTLDQGPALAREIFIRNTGTQTLNGNLWTYFNLHGTQRFSYHKNLWYDAGIALNACETVTAANVPHENILQLKRSSSQPVNCQATEATCNYLAFIGDTGAFSLLPEAVCQGRLLEADAPAALHRFALPAISANRFAFELTKGKSACVLQSLVYITDPEALGHFQELASGGQAHYTALSQAFRAAADGLVRGGPARLLLQSPGGPTPNFAPPFEISLPAEPATAAYLNSAWLGVQELYEKCRAHGAHLADGIELGTRDRAQDMWPKLKEDPAQVRQDLLHALGFMYITGEAPPEGDHRLTLREKLYGMFPRQYPSRWLERGTAVHNDNRPYSDSPLWLLEALAMYIRETGDCAILLDEVPTVYLTDPNRPETSGLMGAEGRLTVIAIVGQVFAAYRRHIQDSPYGLAQVLFGDWCDPVDMFGTSIVGDPSTRGQGRGAQVRLSAHLFLCLVALIDLLEAPSIHSILVEHGALPDLGEWQALADQVRAAVLKWAWEGPKITSTPGFIDCLHELKLDGSTPDYRRGETGYTLGSMRGSDFDGAPRRLLTTQAYGMEMLRTERSYLSSLPEAQDMIAALLAAVDAAMFRNQLGLVLFAPPVANTPQAVRLVGRLGVVPPGCAENGEYHHAQMFMHRFRLNIPGQAGRVWAQFKPALSVTRDERIGGPFDMTSNSYVADEQDPHFGQGMYFGLSGSVDWMIEIVQKLAGVELALHDDRQPDVLVCPTLPEAFGGGLTFKRIIFHALPGGRFKHIPLTVTISPAGADTSRRVEINGKAVEDACVWDVCAYDRLEVRIVG